MTTLTLLAIGDVHLGTLATGLPAALPQLDPAQVSPAAALAAAVDLAIGRRVAAVLLAGDVVESANARFEALVPLEDAIRRLAGAGIPVIGVAGNHDYEALPRLAGLLDGFTLLGAGGRWESVPILRDGSPVATVIGWSFPERWVVENPVPGLPAELLAAAPVALPRIGLLHADLDAAGSRHAPVRRSELGETGLDAWLLGHIHRPSLPAGPRPAGPPPIGYLGSLVGLDPSETGPHGPWLVELGPGGRVALEQIPLAPLRWQGIEVAVDAGWPVEELPERLLAEAERQAAALPAPAPRALGLRARLTGHTQGRIPAGLDGEAERWVREVNGTAVFFHRVEDATEPAPDLAAVARGDDPAGLLARRLLVLREGGSGLAALLADARDALADSAGRPRWQPVAEHRNAGDPLSDSALRARLLQAGMAALAAMLAGEGDG